MISRLFSLSALFACFLPFVAGCSSSKTNAEEELLPGVISIVVSVEPQVTLVERIGGDRVAVAVLVPVGKEPENYQPAPDTVTRMSRAAVFFRIGFPFEDSLMPKLKTVAPKLIVADFRAHLKMRPLELHSHDHSGHDHAGHDHAHHDDDVHTWLGTENLKLQAATVLNTLAALDPENESEYAANYEKLLTDLEKLHVETAERLKPFAGKTIYVFHPAYGYFCDEFNLKQKAIEFEGRTPKPREQADWIRSLGAEEKPTIFVQPEFNRSAAESMTRQSGGQIVVHSPLQRDPLEAIRTMADLIVKHLTPAVAESASKE